jgi:hypothetical protein
MTFNSKVAERNASGRKSFNTSNSTHKNLKVNKRTPANTDKKSSHLFSSNAINFV